MDKLSFTSRFRRDYRREKRRGLEPEQFGKIAELLSLGQPLPEYMKDRPMGDDIRVEGVRSCRVGTSLMLVYRREKGVVWLIRLYRVREKSTLVAPGLWLKALLRSPAKTALTGVLIAAASFLLLYTILDFTITKRTYDDTYSQYHGYVTLEPAESEFSEDIDFFQALPHFLYSDPDSMCEYDPERHVYENYHLPGISSKEINEILALPYLDKVNTRYMTAGISEYERVETECSDFTKSFFNYTDRVIVEGTLKKVYTGVSSSFNALLGAGVAGLDLTDIKVLGGSEESLRQSWYYIDDNSLHVKTDVWEAGSPDSWKAGWIMFNKAIGQSPIVAYLNNVITPEDIAELNEGERYIFVLKIDPKVVTSSGIVEENSARKNPYAFIGDETLAGFWPYIYSIEGQPENYLEQEEFANLRKLIEVTNADRKTLDVVYTEDISSLKRYQDGKLLPVQGRMLTAEDTESRNPVCVIGDNFAAAHGLEVGDRITLQLGDRLFEQYAALGAIASSPKRFAENFTEQEFEIVGTFFEAGLNRLSDTELFWAYSDSTVFVPQSFLPVSEESLTEHEFKPGELTFVIEDAGSIIPFRDGYMEQLEAMGYIVNFYDGGWPAVERQLLQAGELSGLKLAAFSIAAVLAMWLTVYLFILRKKKEFAVMRALGCPVRAAVKTMMLPLVCLAAVAVSAGSTAAVLYTQKAAEQNYAEFAAIGLQPDLSLPVAGIVLGVVCSFGLLLIIAAAMLAFIATRPPLALLQDGVNRAAKTKPQMGQAEEGVPVAFAIGRLMELEPPIYGKRSSVGHTLRYVLRHMKRTGFKSLLALLLALILCFAVGFFTVMRQTYGELYKSIEINPRFVNGFTYTKALEVADSGYVSEGYYEYVDTYCESNFVPNTVVFSNELSRVCPSEVSFKEGWGMDFLSKKSMYCVISRDLAEALGADINSKIELCRQDLLTNIQSGSPVPLSYEELMEQYHDTTAKATVIGIAEDELSRVYLPVGMWETYRVITGAELKLDMAEFRLNDYHQTLNFRAYAERQLNGTAARLSMETEEADRIYQTYRLIELLYPIAFAVAILLGGVLPGIIILQSAKEAALLRVLGTTKRRTRVMLTLEQIMLCALGLALAVAALVGSNGRALYDVAGLLMLYLAAHFVFCVSASTAASVSVTKRKVLELLQVKE